jgi:hypothetical protein
MVDDIFSEDFDTDQSHESAGEQYNLDEPKKPSYFYISMESIDILLGCKATAEQICSFIIATKSRQKNSNYLTAGWNAISKTLSMRPQKAKRIYQELPTLEFDGKRLVKAFISHRTRDLIKLKDTGNIGNSVYFSSDFVGHKTAHKQYPVSKLCSAGDVAARLFLYIQSKSDIELSGCMLSEEAVTCTLTVKNGVVIACGKAPEISITDDVKLAVIADRDGTAKKGNVQAWEFETKEALEKLLSLKLVESAVVAKVYTDESQPTQCWYDIHVHGDPLKGSVRERIKKIADEIGISHGRKDGRSHDKIYHVIIPSGYTVRLCRVIRPVHRHVPDSDKGLRSAGMIRLDNHHTLHNWLNAVEGNGSAGPIAPPRGIYYIPAPEPMTDIAKVNPFESDEWNL